MERCLNSQRKAYERQFIIESTSIEEEMLEDDEDDIVDPESIPPEVMDKIDKQLDTIIASDSFDDTDIEELIDEDGDEVAAAAGLTETINDLLYIIR